MVEESVTSSLTLPKNKVLDLKPPLAANDWEKIDSWVKYLQFLQCNVGRITDGNISPGHLYIACFFLYFHWKCEKGRCDEKYIKLSVVCAPVCPCVATSDFHLPNNEPTTKCVLYLPHSQIQVGKHQKNPLALKSIVPCRKKHTTILTYTTFQRIIIFDKENNGWKFFVELMNQKKNLSNY